MVFLKEFFKNVDFEKSQQMTKNVKNFPGGKGLKKSGDLFYKNIISVKQLGSRSGPAFCRA